MKHHDGRGSLLAIGMNGQPLPHFNGFPARLYSYTAFGSTPYQVNCNNPFLSASQAQVVCGADAYLKCVASLIEFAMNAQEPVTAPDPTAVP